MYGKEKIYSRVVVIIMLLGPLCVQAEVTDLGVVGRTYPVKEPDILNEMVEKAKEILNEF